MLNWPVCSPDISPIENIWWIIKGKIIRQRQPQTLQQLETYFRQEWDQIPTPGARFNKEVQPTLSLNLNSELSYSEMGNSEFSVTEQLNCVSLLNSK